MQKIDQSEAFGHIIARKRRALGLTQEQLALRCGDVLSKSYLSQLETIRTLKDGVTPLRPNEEIVDALADALGESRDYFRKLNGYPTENEGIEDPIAEEFVSSLNRYRLLDESAREFIQRQMRTTIDFLLEYGDIEDDGNQQRILHKDPKSLPGITLEEAKRRAKKK